MPVLRTTKTYRCRSGKRFVRLYRSWYNIRSRVRGEIRSGNGRDLWRGLAVEWATFEQYRAWALRAGYSRARCSLDRIDPQAGYTAANCRFLTVRENSYRALRPDPWDMGGTPLFARDGACPF